MRSDEKKKCMEEANRIAEQAYIKSREEMGVMGTEEESKDLIRQKKVEI